MPAHLIQSVAILAAAAALLAAASSDLRRYLIPDAAALVVAGAALAIAPWRGAADAAWGVAIAACVFAAGAAMFARGWTGGGDVKLASACAFWATPATVSGWALVTALAGAGLGLALLTPLRARLPAAPEGSLAGAGQPMPYGVALAAGGLWLLIGRVAAL